MFTMEIAGVPIGVYNRFPDVEGLCRNYLTDRQPAFTVSVTDEEIRREQQLAGEPNGFDEELCLYRHIALRMMEYDAFLMHAAVIAVDGDGVAFAARSGTGKTTRVRLWTEALGDRVKVVNGDKPILRFTENGLYAFGTPWMGKENMGENTSAPLRALCFIKRGEDVSLRRITADEVLPKLFQQVLIPKEEEMLDRFLTLMNRLMLTTPCFLLTCNREKEKPADIWEQIRTETAPVA